MCAPTCCHLHHCVVSWLTTRAVVQQYAPLCSFKIVPVALDIVPAASGLIPARERHNGSLCRLLSCTLSLVPLTKHNTCTASAASVMRAAVPSICRKRLVFSGSRPATICKAIAEICLVYQSSIPTRGMTGLHSCSLASLQDINSYCLWKQKAALRHSASRALHNVPDDPDGILSNIYHDPTRSKPSVHHLQGFCWHRLIQSHPNYCYDLGQVRHFALLVLESRVRHHRNYLSIQVQLQLLMARESKALSDPTCVAWASSSGPVNRPGAKPVLA